MLFNLLTSLACAILLLEDSSTAISVVEEIDAKNLTLVFANVLFRHGDRTPVKPYPSDPYANDSYWPDGWGQLTNTGKEQHYELGKWLRERYRNFLPEEFHHTDIHVRSTDMARTLMSAACNLAGLFPPKGRQVWDNKMAWQPIPIHTEPENLDKILAGKKHCPRLDRETEKVKKSEELKKYNKEHAKLYEYVGEMVEDDVNDPESLEFIYNTLFIENLYNLTLPKWTKKVFPDKMAPVAAYSFTIPARTKIQQRLKIGPLLKEMIANMRVVDKKLRIYSAHDTTVANMLMTLGVFDPQSPPYRSLVLIELYNDENKNPYVLVSYRNSTTREPYQFAIPGCTTYCPLDKFVELLEPVIPINWERECKEGYFFDDLEFNTLAIIAVATSGILALLLMMSMICGITYWKKQKSSSNNYYYHRLQQEVN